MSSRIVRIQIIGCGSSSSTPALLCATTDAPCPQCAEAMKLGYTSPNHRLNPSLLVQIEDGQDGRLRNVVVDVGKTFRESALKVLAPNRVARIDSVIITHDHVDACWGVDDLREFSRNQGPIDVHCDQRTMDSMRRCFPYLFGTSTTFVADLAWHLLDTGDLILHGVKVIRFPVFHGVTYVTNGFIFPTEQGPVVYISDVSAVPPESAELLDSHKPIHTLVVDMMSQRQYVSHFNVDEALSFADSLGASQTRFVGMSHSLNYATMNSFIATERGLTTMALSRDGEIVFQAVNLPQSASGAAEEYCDD
jgi:phosphoribosyl 1,2-cyclic phosphodiesterase